MIKRYFPLLSFVPVAPCVHSGITNDDSAKSFSIICLIYPFSIIKKNGAYYVRDERSTNGTFVNGEQVLPDTERLLLNNSKLTLGDEEFLYSLW